MKKFIKNYIGKGKSVEGLNIAKVTCKLDELIKYAYEYDGVKYVTFEVAKMKEADNYGRDFTVYVSKKEEVTEEAPKGKKKSKKSKKQNEPELQPADKDEDLPF
jgi:phage protein D